ncbi:hypothetical protein [Streptomyces sp. NPDC059639]|uniref:hypothetical protein n=1 Tax=Streptomyces sp. NPDC059639 TaxID=3346891 RepID=UPI003687A85D
MTSTIMARPTTCTTQTICPPDAVVKMNDLVQRMVREADTRVPAERKVRRTLQEMAPGYERQPVLTLHRPTMADDACPLCGKWNCDPATCPPSAAVTPAPVEAGPRLQCAVCGGEFGVAPGQSLTVTAWMCDACAAKC